MIKEILKRDGTVQSFDIEKITNAIYKAAVAVGGDDRELAKRLSEEVVSKLEQNFGGRRPHVEDVQDMVEKVLIENGHAKTAKAFILYREKRHSARKSTRLSARPLTCLETIWAKTIGLSKKTPMSKNQSTGSITI